MVGWGRFAAEFILRVVGLARHEREFTPLASATEFVSIASDRRTFGKSTPPKASPNNAPRS
jgi:hypothetical protein